MNFLHRSCTIGSCSKLVSTYNFQQKTYHWLQSTRRLVPVLYCTSCAVTWSIHHSSFISWWSAGGTRSSASEFPLQEDSSGKNGLNQNLAAQAGQQRGCHYATRGSK
jgi:hypothetical protein